EPGERPQGAGDPGPHHGRLRADGEDVRGDRSERAELAEPARDAREPGEQQRSTCHEHDVLARDAQEVIEPGGSEPLTQLVRETLVDPEHDALDKRPALAPQPAGRRAREPRAQPVGEAADSAAAPDLPPVVHAQNDVYAVTAEPRPLVEPVRRSARKRDDAEDVEDRTLRGRSSERQLEQDLFMDPERPEPREPPGQAYVEPAEPGRTRHDDP